MSEMQSRDEGPVDIESRTREVARVLTDATLFPIEFRNWLKNFIETSGITLPSSSIIGGSGRERIVLPAGMIVPYAGSTPPGGNASLVCNGQEVSRSEYSILFDAIGTLYGAGDGSTTFLVPDLRDRAIFGVGSQVAMAASDGAALGSRGPNHHHSATLSGSMSGGTNDTGDHSHEYTSPSWETLEINIGQTNFFAYPQRLNNAGASTGGGGSHSHSVNVSGSVSGNTSGSGAKDTVGFVGMLYVIVTGL